LYLRNQNSEFEVILFTTFVSVYLCKFTFLLQELFRKEAVRHLNRKLAATKDFIELREIVYQLKTKVEETIIILIQHSRYSKHVPENFCGKAKSVSDSNLNSSLVSSPGPSSPSAENAARKFDGSALGKTETPKVGKIKKKIPKRRSFTAGPREIYTSKGRLSKPVKRLSYGPNFTQIP
jgi:hypothetical protein